MNFDLFEHIDFRAKVSLLHNCKGAEQNAQIEPYNSISSARSALDDLCRNILKENNKKAKKDPDGKVTLATMIETCIEENLFQSGADATIVRKSGNQVLHANLEESMHVANVGNITMAKLVVKSLFVVMQQAFGLTNVEFDEKKMPFGELQVVRAVPKARREMIQGDYNYFVRNAKEDYFYMQIYPANSRNELETLLVERHETTRSKIKSYKGRQNYLLPSQVVNDLFERADRLFVTYSVYEDSFLLSELTEPMTENQAIQVGIDLVESLLEMKKIGAGIHHRNIQPGCVMITPNEDTYMAALVNMETAKIQNYEGTIIGSLRDFLTENEYMPREVRYYKEGQQQIDWERADVYSVAKVMIYCVAPELVQADVDYKKLQNYFNDNMIKIFRVIFESTLSDSYNLTEMRSVLKNAFAEPDDEEYY